MSPIVLTHGEVEGRFEQFKKSTGIDVGVIPDRSSSQHPPIPTDTPEYWQIRIGKYIDYTLFNSGSRYNPDGEVRYEKDMVSPEVPKQHRELVESVLESIVVHSSLAEQPSQ